MQLGFVLDQSRCIGCHACTVACKSENDVPLGNFRTWVKYTEEGAYPEVKRSFTVLRCNQCTDAPCVSICPVTALEKRPDGIVDLDRDVCIGCKACMQACPYDALHINPGTGTAEKCHFCAHRVEMGLAPACAVVCPTEAIVPGDFDDPASAVSHLRQTHALTARKEEAGTGPNVLYLDADPAGLEPLSTQGTGGYLWAQQVSGLAMDAREFDAMDARAAARTTYNVDHAPPWGTAITGYLFFKSLAAGLFLIGAPFLAPLVPSGEATTAAAVGLPLLALLCLGVTMGLLVADLKRPDRFLSIMLRPNWTSWLAKGSFVLAGYGGLLTLWLVFGLMGYDPGGVTGALLTVVTLVAAALSAAYTAWLFRQAKGRVLWMKKWFGLHLVAQAAVAGAAALLVIGGLTGGVLGTGAHEPRWVLILALVIHLALVLSEEVHGPDGRDEEYGRTVRLITHGPFARIHWLVGIVVGGALPLCFLVVPGADGLWVLAGVLALVGLYVEEDVFVRAGQALPIS